MRVDALRNYPLDSEVRTVGDVLDILIALGVVAYDTKIDARADEESRAERDARKASV